MSSKNSFDLLAEVPIKEKVVTDTPAPNKENKPFASKNAPSIDSSNDLNPIQKQRKAQSPHRAGPNSKGFTRNREFDRRSGTGRSYENKKHGSGKGNWGNEEKGTIYTDSLPQDLDAIPSKSVDILDMKVESLDDEPTNSTKPASPQKPESVETSPSAIVQKTYSDYIKEKEEKSQEIDNILLPPPPRKVENSWYKSDETQSAPSADQTSAQTKKEKRVPAVLGFTYKRPKFPRNEEKHNGDTDENTNNSRRNDHPRKNEQGANDRPRNNEDRPRKNEDRSRENEDRPRNNEDRSRKNEDRPRKNEDRPRKNEQGFSDLKTGNRDFGNKSGKQKAGISENEFPVLGKS